MSRPAAAHCRRRKPRAKRVRPDVTADLGGTDVDVVTTTAIETGIGRVHSTLLADGKLVQLGGCLGEADLPALRLALLMPPFEGCQDIVIDAGEVDEIDDCAVAVLMAGCEWAQEAGVRILLSRSTMVFDDTLEALDLVELLPRLSAPAQALAQLTLVPAQRASAD